MIHICNVNQQLEIPSKIDNLSKIEVFVDELCENLKINEDSYGSILIALTEAVNNAITHGNQSDPSKKVNLGVSSTGDEILFTVKDEGQGFDYQNVPDPTLPENLEKLHGRGVFLMNTLADDIEFGENGSLVKLKFYVPTN